MNLAPGGQLRMRALQLALKRSWDFQDDLVLVPWDGPSREDLLWWSADGRLEEGVCLVVVCWTTWFGQTLPIRGGAQR